MLQSNREIRHSPRMPESLGIHGKYLVWSGNSGNDWKFSGIIRKWLKTTCANFPFCLTVRQNGLFWDLVCFYIACLEHEFLVSFSSSTLSFHRFPHFTELGVIAVCFLRVPVTTASVTTACNTTMRDTIASDSIACNTSACVKLSRM